MSELERYHGNDDDIIPQRKKQDQKVYKNTVHETLPDSDTEEAYKELFTQKPKDGFAESENFDYVGNPDDVHLLAVEREELMKKYENINGSTDSERPSEFIVEPAEAKGDVSISKKHESMKEGFHSKRKEGYRWTQRENLKTTPDTKKQRFFRGLIRKFLDFN
ncbi:MAG: hypothetical protein QG594_400 [Bacteroidota bacterium]|jgi:hypothetical protein|nr:hypothetical protein [Bacteroidota bacterium]